MDYKALLKKSFDLTIKNKFLWIFGLFAGAGMTFSGMNMSDFTKKGPGMDPLFTKEQISAFLYSHWTLVLWIALGLLVLCIICFIISLFAEASLITGAAALSKGEKTDFSLALKKGSQYFWKLWGLGIMYFLIILVGLAISAIPTGLLVLSNQMFIAAFYGVLTVLAFIALAVIVGFSAPYAERILVLENKGITESIKTALILVRKKILEVFIVNLILIAFSTVLAFALAIALVIILIMLGLLGFGLWSLSNGLGIIYAFVLGSALFVAIMIFKSAFSTFKSVVITEAYEKFKSKP